MVDFSSRAFESKKLADFLLTICSFNIPGPNLCDFIKVLRKGTRIISPILAVQYLGNSRCYILISTQRKLHQGIDYRSVFVCFRNPKILYKLKKKTILKDENYARL